MERATRNRKKKKRNDGVGRRRRKAGIADKNGNEDRVEKEGNRWVERKKGREKDISMRSVIGGTG